MTTPPLPESNTYTQHKPLQYPSTPSNFVNSVPHTDMKRRFNDTSDRRMTIRLCMHAAQKSGTPRRRCTTKPGEGMEGKGGRIATRQQPMDASISPCGHPITRERGNCLHYMYVATPKIISNFPSSSILSPDHGVAVSRLRYSCLPLVWKVGRHLPTRAILQLTQGL